MQKNQRKELEKQKKIKRLLVMCTKYDNLSQNENKGAQSKINTKMCTTALASAILLFGGFSYISKMHMLSFY